jgi:hypothetical protein
MRAQDRLDLTDYRLQVQSHYAKTRTSALPQAERCNGFRQARDELIGSHAQSALSPEQKTLFKKLDYFAYDPSWRFLLDIDEDVELEILEIPLAEDGVFRMRRLGKVNFEREDQFYTLTLFWVLGYGGGIFLPFRDTSRLSGATYGGTRYLLDTIKGADLGQDDGKLILDFNYAYNPSCAYNPIWDCPLAPQENWLELSIPVGERAVPGSLNIF